ncbi:MAG: FAD-binding oxidoreductase [Cyclobacteriaceae bacterium]|nr:FAD-binding oxidoreductase [Cyclobacteriaceae bacterium]MCH8515528.1 FAD-binding oxidoreductase [Cyclobacteriaceae bacterium]
MENTQSTSQATLDALIIGQGIAGSILAHELLEAGLQVRIIDKPQPRSSSRIAGGLYNPITGRTMVKTWRADELFPHLEDYYRNLEQKLKARFLRDCKIFRPFFTQEEQNEWLAQWDDDRYRHAIERIDTGQMDLNKHLKATLGGLYLKNAGTVETLTLVEAFTRHFINLGIYKEASFDEHAMELTSEGLIYEGVHYRRLIFANGYQAGNSQYFGWLPFRPVSGDILELECEQEPYCIYNRGIFLTPKGDRGTSRCGSTYRHKPLDEQVNDEGVMQIESKLQKLVNFNYKIVNAVAGIRPATYDRKPFLGRHPKHNQLYIFNGLGAKGVSLAPFFATQLKNHLLNKNYLIDSEVNITRCEKKFFNH